MTRVSVTLMALAVLSGCANIRSTLAGECQGRGEAECIFVNAPIALSSRSEAVEGRAYPFFRTTRPLSFVDAGGREWLAPRGTMTDGASIPPVFEPIIGPHDSPEFALAAAIHDAYCGYGNEESDVYRSRGWRAVHRMFYEALRVGGVGEIRAKTMYAAVMMGGPRWNPFGEGEGQQLPQGHSRPELAEIDTEALQQRFRETAEMIARDNPSLDVIDRQTAYSEIIDGVRYIETFDTPAEERVDHTMEDGTTVTALGLPAPGPNGGFMVPEPPAE